jgi:hypothetical protein
MGRELGSARWDAHPRMGSELRSVRSLGSSLRECREKTSNTVAAAGVSRLKIQFGARICQSTPCSNLLLKKRWGGSCWCQFDPRNYYPSVLPVSIFGNAGARRIAVLERRWRMGDQHGNQHPPILNLALRTRDFQKFCMPLDVWV